MELDASPAIEKKVHWKFLPHVRYCRGDIIQITSLAPFHRYDDPKVVRVDRSVVHGKTYAHECFLLVNDRGMRASTGRPITVHPASYKILPGCRKMLVRPMPNETILAWSEKDKEYTEGRVLYHADVESELLDARSDILAFLDGKDVSKKRVDYSLVRFREREKFSIVSGGGSDAIVKDVSSFSGHSFFYLSPAAPATAVHVGQRVKIRSGLLEGMCGFVTDITPLGHVNVSVDWLGVFRVSPYELLPDKSVCRSASTPASEENLVFLDDGLQL